MTITEFLLARVAEDEVAATGMKRDGWAMANHASRADRAEKLQALALGMRCPTCHAIPGQTCVAMTPPTQAPRPAASLHATRMDLGRAEYRRSYGGLNLWNQARVLRQCEAIRHIVEFHQNIGGLPGREVYADSAAVHRALGITLEHLAAIWADHPDYQTEWAE